MKQNQRLNDIEGQIKLLRLMNRPPGAEGEDGPDIFDALQEIKDDLRKEVDTKLDALTKKMKDLEKKLKTSVAKVEMLNNVADRHDKSIENAKKNI